MSAKDISRFLFQPQKRYSSVRMQQGRVVLDSDWNESERIDDEEARRILAETVCAKGTPNEGFLVRRITEAKVTKKVTYDFTLASGSFYLGGLRFEIVPEIVERFLSQTDWLQIDADLGNLPFLPSLDDLEGGEKSRVDLVYLRGWEQCVTAVEDSELRERALGGPDTSVRMRRMRRIEVLPDVDLDLTIPRDFLGFCADAFAKLKVQLAAPREGDGTGEPHLFDDTNCELRSKARLTVTFSGEGITDDPCKPTVTAGFLGAENQTIRVQLTATNRFIWGYDNASPFYRVQVLEEEGQPVKIKFLTLPRDQAAQSLKGQAVEILPWGAFLPNQEKVAELQGHLATVATSFNPEEKTITISKPVPQAWIDWLNARAHAQYLSERDPADKKKYFYLRLWTGGSGDAEEPDHAFTPGTPVELSGTGLNVTFSKHGLPGDFWIIAARPNTPDLVVPWDLLKEAPPAGPRFFFTPLALIVWSVDRRGTTVLAEIQDCRHKFRPLCEVGEELKVSTGLVVFQDVRAGEFRESPPIAHGLDVNYVAIIMAVEMFIFEPRPGDFVFIGDVSIASSFFPSMVAMYDPNDPSKEFSIVLKDRVPVGGKSPPSTWQIRWWAIPKTLDQPDVTVPPPPGGEFPPPGKFLLAQLIMRPGITVQELAENLRVEPSEIQPELDRLREAGRIRVEGERLFLVSRVTPSPRPGLTERIIEFIRNNPESTLTRLTRGLGVDLAVLEPEVGRLVVEGLIRRDPRGSFTLSEPK
jgi:DNA-binding MarR family transcriptional regulator